MGWGWSSPKSPLQLTLDMGGVGRADTYLLSCLHPSSCLCDLGQVLGLLGLQVLLVISLSSQQDRYHPFVGHWGSESCHVLLTATQSQHQIWEAPCPLPMTALLEVVLEWK